MNNEGKCRSCGAALIWARTPSNAKMPLDAEPHAEGNVLLEPDRVNCRVLSKNELTCGTFEVGQTFHRSHFSTCPDARQFRKDKAQKTKGPHQ